ncbi:fungal-specific transcription factor domain-containing protein, partial [Schizophyllum fasciatum]
MPPAAKQKRAAADRAKGASRAKSGCYTCRIRRKKCDEELGQDGQCKTCSRLRLQCLGFGTKRPDYLRVSSARFLFRPRPGSDSSQDNEKVNEMRDKIKLHLATNGMIKGHAGASSRAMDDRPVCVLHESTSSDVRDDKYPTCLEPRPSTSAPPAPSYEDPPRNPPALMAPSPASVELPQPFGPDAPPQYVSSFGHMYNDSSWGAFFDDSFPSAEFDNLDYMSGPHLTIPAMLVQGTDEFIYKYCSRLAKAQFLLADESKFADILFGPMQDSELLKNAARLLSMVDDNRTRDPTRRALSLSEVKQHHDALWVEAMVESGGGQLMLQPKTPEEIATAAIITVSAHLFDGGRGRWKQWLTVACKWAHHALHSTQYPPALALIMCTERKRFLIKTAMWFDVLASVTTQRPPIFADTFRALFAPSESGVSDPDAPTPNIDPHLSMLDIMGCENNVVWALSETTCLAAWKAEEERAGRLSNKDLVARATAVENVLAQPRPGPPLGSTFGGVGYDRQLTADIFHAAARLYLHTVVSGAHPRVPDISRAVNATIAALQRVQGVPSGAAIVRNTVFASFIAGALADGAQARADVQAILELGAGGAGNCRAVIDLLHKIWAGVAVSSPSNP